MYVVAPALPAPYKWLQVPLSALHTDRWPGYFAMWPERSNIRSYYVMIPAELKDAFFRNPSMRDASQWSLAVIATATVVTSAMALYYYATYNGFEPANLNLGYYVSLLSPQEFNWTSGFSFSFLDLNEDDEEDHDDDEHIDPELLDGFESANLHHCCNVRLVSADPTSDLCHRPLHMDLLEGKTSRKPLCSGILKSPRASILKQPNQSVWCDLRKPADTPNLRHSRSFQYASSSPRGSWVKEYTISKGGKRLKTCSSSDYLTVLPEQKCPAYERASHSTKNPSRRVSLTEPDWQPFADSHYRARQRTVLAKLVKTYLNKSLDSTTPSTPTEQMADKFFKETLPQVSSSPLRNGSEFWFERFAGSTAAGRKRSDFRRRKRTLADSFNSSVFDKLIHSPNAATPE